MEVVITVDSIPSMKILLHLKLYLDIQHMSEVSLGSLAYIFKFTKHVYCDFISSVSP